MALGEKRKTIRRKQTISQVSWTDGTSLDPYYGLENSFQYAKNINCDDELHGIKLSQKALYFEDYTDPNTHKKINLGKSQLVSIGDYGIVALPIGDERTNLRVFNEEDFSTGGAEFGTGKGGPNTCPGSVFQNHFWYARYELIGGTLRTALFAKEFDGSGHGYIPHDHTDTTDDIISDPTNDNGGRMLGPITAILNYNNSRLVVADGSDVWVYYPELDLCNPRSPLYYLNPDSPYYDPSWDPDDTEDYGKTGWKKTLSFEWGVDIVGLTCTFEYLKVRCRDKGWNSKVYYYQGNNNLRDTFVYNVIDLTGQRVVNVYSVNSVDYFVTSTDGSNGYVNLNKMVGTTPIQLLKQRAGLDPLDVNFKAPYFVGPVSLDAPYQSGKFYIADIYGVFSFDFNPTGYDTGYMKWGLNNRKRVYGACIHKNFLYVSDEDGCWKIRIYDTGVDGYQEEGVLISREFEGLEGGNLTKVLDSIRVNYELNPLTQYNGTIDVYVSPNNLWKNTNPQGKGLPLSMDDYDDNDYDGWYHVMHLGQENIGTRTERTEVVNKLGPGGIPALGFDWQTITYAIKITRYTTDDQGSASEKAKKLAAEHATPILRQIDLNYHTKDKINNVYDINNN